MSKTFFIMFFIIACEPTKQEYVEKYSSYLCGCNDTPCDSYLLTFEDCEYDSEFGRDCLEDLDVLDKDECDFAPLSCEAACPIEC